jgi:hypothetical protein
MSGEVPETVDPATAEHARDRGGHEGQVKETARGGLAANVIEC